MIQKLFIDSFLYSDRILTIQCFGDRKTMKNICFINIRCKQEQEWI